jgi:hypothetical protein
VTNLVWSLAVLIVVAAGLGAAWPGRRTPSSRGWARAGEVDAIVELGGRARVCGIPVMDVERPSAQRLLLGLADGTALDLSLLWQRDADPTRVVDLRWWDDRGWVLRAETSSGVELYPAWRCRLALP